MKKKPYVFTQTQILAAKNLGRIWDLRKSEFGFTQEQAAGALECTQGAIHQYVRGKIPLGTTAVLKFAKFLHVPPTDIDPSLIRLFFSPEHEEVINMFDSMTEQHRALWKDTGRAFVEATKAENKKSRNPNDMNILKKMNDEQNERIRDNKTFTGK